jgi:hypothetical protein
VEQIFVNVNNVASSQGGSEVSVETLRSTNPYHSDGIWGLEDDIDVLMANHPGDVLVQANPGETLVWGNFYKVDKDDNGMFLNRTDGDGRLDITKLYVNSLATSNEESSNGESSSLYSIYTRMIAPKVDFASAGTKTIVVAVGEKSSVFTKDVMNKYFQVETAFDGNYEYLRLRD